MGQQQLLLIVLGVIIVGVAVVAGIGMFNANAEESVKDEISAQCVSIGANAQQMFRKPVAIGGLGGTFANYIVPPKMSVTTNAGTMDETTGSITKVGYAASGHSATQVTITGTPNDASYKWTVVTTVKENSIATVVTATK